MAVSRPSTPLPGWATGNYPAGSNGWSSSPSRVDPGAGNYSAGFTPNTKAAAQYANWLHGLSFDWGNYLDDQRAQMVAGTIPSIGAQSSSPTSTTPIGAWHDAQGNLKYLVDHNGYPMGRRSEYRLEWGGVSNVPTSSTTAIAGSAFQFSGTAGCQMAAVQGSSSFPSPFGSFNPGSTSGSGTILSVPGGSPPVFPLYMGSAFTAVMEWEAALSGAATANSQYYMGFSDGYSPANFKGIAQCMQFYCKDAATGWGIRGYNSSAVLVEQPNLTTFVNGTYPTTAFKIEMIGPSGLGGAVTRFYINGTLVGTSIAGVAQGAVTFGAGTYNSLNTLGTQPNLYIGPIQVTWARFASVPAL